MIVPTRLPHPAPKFLKSPKPTDSHRGRAVSNPGILGLNTAQSLAQRPRNWPAESVQVWELEQASGCTTLRLTLCSRDRQMYAQRSAPKLPPLTQRVWAILLCRSMPREAGSRACARHEDVLEGRRNLDRGQRSPSRSGRCTPAATLPVLIEYEAGWAADPVRTFWRRQISSFPRPEFNHGSSSPYPSRYLVWAIPAHRESSYQQLFV